MVTKRALGDGICTNVPPQEMGWRGADERWLQDVLPALYRGHDALLFTSRYEAWGMPVLEGMASGLPVVAASCLGVQTFAQHGVNALLADPQVLLVFIIRCWLQWLVCQSARLA